jgi:hypothetical protein
VIFFLVNLLKSTNQIYIWTHEAIWWGLLKAISSWLLAISYDYKLFANRQQQIANNFL